MRLLSFAVILFFNIGTSAQASDFVDEKSAIRQLLGAQTVKETQFTKAFLDAVPMSKLTRVLRNYREVSRSIVAIVRENDQFRVTTSSHQFHIDISLNSKKKIAGLWVRPIIEIASDLQSQLQNLLTMGDKVSYLITRNGDEVEAHNPDQALAVGSAFKMAVLAALQDRIKEGSASWSDVIRLKDYHLSLPSGILQTMPVGAPLTLHTVAALMIARSDNTATDVLMDFAGREAVGRHLKTDAPLTTREFFILKTNDDLRQAYLAASPTRKLAILGDVRKHSLPSKSTALPHHQDGVEWYVSARALCGLMGKVRSLKIMTLNPGLSLSGSWKHVAYKAGSESGVLNLSFGLVDDQEQQWCVAVTLNSRSEISLAKATGAVASLISSLRPSR